LFVASLAEVENPCIHDDAAEALQSSQKRVKVSDRVISVLQLPLDLVVGQLRLVVERFLVLPFGMGVWRRKPIPLVEVGRQLLSLPLESLDLVVDLDHLVDVLHEGSVSSLRTESMTGDRNLVENLVLDVDLVFVEKRASVSNVNGMILGLAWDR